MSQLMKMMPTHDPEQFRTSPVGRCLVGTTYVVWCAAPDLAGLTMWGSLDDRSIREMLAIGTFARHPDIASQRRVLIDCRDLETVDTEILLGFQALTRDRGSPWNGVARQAVLVPDGIRGILLAGTFASLGISHPLRITHELEPAVAFLEDDEAASAHAQAARIAGETRGPAELLLRLRNQLRRELNDATIGSTAAALAMSTRTLQRGLRDLHTSFTDELRRVRMWTAELMLLHSQLKIEAIASQVGFGTASRMSATFRRELNVTASALRARLQAQEGMISVKPAA